MIACRLSFTGVTDSLANEKHVHPGRVTCFATRADAIVCLQSITEQDGSKYAAQKVAARYNLVPDKHHRVK